MPASIGSKPPEPAKKKHSDETKTTESSKSLEKDADSRCNEVGLQPPPGDGGVPMKKPAQPRKKIGEEKKSGISVLDRVPKTKAQRARGSIALNKTVDMDSTGKKQGPSPSSDKFSRPNTREGGSINETRKVPVAVRSKPKVKPEAQLDRDLKNAKKRKPWVAVLEKTSNETLEEKTVGIVEQESKEVKSDDIRPVNPASNSCSFFEKLQQGVRAYFSSRNSFNPSMDEKNKKKVTEGGIRIRARVAKGVKEDHKKRKPGKVIKNKIYNSEGDLWYDRFRVKSSTGGESGNFSSDKPKIFRHFRKLKRKKLYRPIKHCVRIQIPRKGYFYRSTVRFKAPGSAPSLQRLESSFVPKSKPKVQIPGMASTSPKVPNLLKKRLINQGENIQEVVAPVNSRASTPKKISSYSMKYPSSAFSREMLVYSFEQKVTDYIATNWPEKKVKRCEKTSAANDAERPLGNENSKPGAGRHCCAILENSLSCNNQKSKSQMKRKSKNSKKNSSREKDDVKEVLETSSEKVISMSKTQKTTQPSETSFETLLSCITSALGKDEAFYDLEISPVITGGRECAVGGDFQMPSDSFALRDLEGTEVISAFNDYYNNVGSPEADAIYLSPSLSVTLFDSDDNGDHVLPRKDSIAKILIGEIDLHVELENYIKTMDGFSSAKNRTKNTLQCNLYEGNRSLDSNYFDLQNRTDEFFDVVEIKSSSTFASATSVCTQQDGDVHQLHVFLDRKHDMACMSEEHFDPRTTKIFISQTQLKDKIDEIRKIKSDNDPKKIQQEGKSKSSIKRTFGKTSFQPSRMDNEKIAQKLPLFQSELLMNGLVDSYEKILPFQTYSNKNYEVVRKRSSLLYTNAVYSLSAESLRTGVRKASSDSDQCKFRANPFHQMEESRQIESEFLRKTSNSTMSLEETPLPELRKRKWSPTLQELIEIYNSVLKHNNKLRRDSRNKVNDCLSSQLFSFLDEKLKEKKNKADMMMLSKNFKKNLKSSGIWKPSKQKKDDLVAYVTMFQEILHSSLSISQISRLNHIMSSLQECSEKNYNLVRNLKSREIIKKPEQEKPLKGETNHPVDRMDEKPKSNLDPPKKSKKKQLKKKLEVPDKTARPQTATSQIRLKTQSTADEPLSTEKIKSIELSSPTELETILQSSFNKAGLSGKNLNDKILVTVQLCGNQVLVSGLSYFKNEETLAQRKISQRGTSELIIESAPKDEVESVWSAKKNSNKLKDKRKIENSEKPKMPKEHDLVAATKTVKPPKAAPKEEEEYIDASSDDKNSFFLEDSVEPEGLVQFEYDQMQLRVQHPIEAIIESSESKLSDHIENFDAEQPNQKQEPPTETKILLTDIYNTSKLSEALKEALAKKVFSKSLTCDFSWSDNGIDKALSRDTKKELMRKQGSAKKKAKHAKTVRSLNDLNKGTTKRKSRRLNSSYACYPTVLNLQGKFLKVRKRSKKELRQKNRSAYSSKTKINQNRSLHPRQHKVINKSSKEVELVALKSNAGIPPMSDTKPTLLTGQENFEKVSVKPSTNTVLFINREVIPDCCSTELLYYDSEDPSTNVIPNVSPMTENLKPLSEQLLLPLDAKEPNPSPMSAIIGNGIKGSPIVIHASDNDSDDTSFPSVMIHSDSFLKYYSSFPLAQSGLNYLFKSSSDMKFYPGRVLESEGQQSPFIKFVLTPTQNAEAGLPPNQVLVVDKTYAAENGVTTDCFKKEKRAAEEEINEKIPLASIEKFIKDLSKSKKKEKAKSKATENCKQEKKQMTSGVARQGQRNKGGRFSPSQQTRNTDRKVYHECQKTKLANKNAKSKVAAVKAKPANYNGVRDQAKKESSEPNFLSLKNFILSFSRLMESYQNNWKENFENQREQKSEEGGEKGLNLTEKRSKIVFENGKGERHSEKGTNTTVGSKCSLSRLLHSAPVTPEKPLQAFRSANTQTEDIRGTEDINDICCVPLTSTVTPRKSKTLKIKIICDDRNCKESGKLDNAAHGEVSNAEAVNGYTQRAITEIGLLDSLVSTGKNLERRKSTYFDAVEGFSEEEDDGNRRQESHEAAVGQSAVGKSFFPHESRAKESGEVGLENILKSLQDNQVCHSLTLMDDFLRQAEHSTSWSGDPEKLKQVLLLVEKKSRDLMMRLEKNAWLKVLSLLEEVSQMFQGEGGDLKDFKTRSTSSADKIQGLRNSQSFCSTFLQSTLKNENHVKNVLCRITDSLSFFRNKTSEKGDRCSEFQNREGARESRSKYQVHSTISLPQIPETLNQSTGEPRENPVQLLRKHIQQQRAYIEYLLSADCESVPQEIQNVKKKVAEKMQAFDNIFSALGEKFKESGSPRETVNSWSKAASLLKTCRNVMDRNFASGFVKPQRGLMKKYLVGSNRHSGLLP